MKAESKFCHCAAIAILDRSKTALYSEFLNSPDRCDEIHKKDEGARSGAAHYTEVKATDLARIRAHCGSRMTQGCDVLGKKGFAL